ncbi:MAG: CoA-binding protein [Treponema sp.]|jgi:redox-sensing transcriptional repressor|nr:CoA-binding protein [Treponema sp.]
MASIPEPAKERLLHLMRLLEKQGAEPVTSAQVELLTGWPGHRIRKDISYLGGQGGETAGDGPAGSNPGLGSNSGYSAELLIPAIRKALNLDRRRLFCLAGLGRLGSAFLNFSPAELGEFDLAAGFDTNVNRVEILPSRVPLYPAYKMGEIIGRFSIEMALLCVPAGAAQETAEKLAAAGIRGILNFAPVALRLPPAVAVRNVYLADELRGLAVKMGN